MSIDINRVFYLFISKFKLYCILIVQELGNINEEALLARIQDVLDERVKPVKGKIGMQRQRFRAIKIGVDLMLDVCRRTHNDLETELEGKSFTCIHMMIVCVCVCVHPSSMYSTFSCIHPSNLGF